MEQGGMTLAQCAAYRAKRQREHPAREALTRRLRQAVETFDTYLDTLSYLTRLVESVEQVEQHCLAEERALPTFRGPAFMRELVMEDYQQWPEMLYGPYPLTRPGDTGVPR